MPDTNQDTLPPAAAAAVPSSGKRQKPKTENDTSKNDVHIVLQAKGGVGKSFIAWVLSQYLEDSRRYDLDPLNPTLGSFPALRAQRLDVGLASSDTIDEMVVDGMVDDLVTGPGSAVIDTGANVFLPIARYLLEGDVHAVLADHGRRLVVHTVVVGGQHAIETLSGMEALARQFPTTVPLVVWVNEHTGAFRLKDQSFEDTALYAELDERIAGRIIHLPQRATLHERALRNLLDRHLTFAETTGITEISLMAKSRLNQIRNELWMNLDRVTGNL